MRDYDWTGCTQNEIMAKFYNARARLKTATKELRYHEPKYLSARRRVNELTHRVDSLKRVIAERKRTS